MTTYTRLKGIVTTTEKPVDLTGWRLHSEIEAGFGPDGKGALFHDEDCYDTEPELISGILAKVTGDVMINWMEVYVR